MKYEQKTRLNLGFTIIEIIFSLAIFAVLFIATSSLLFTTLKISQNAKYQYQAMSLAQKRFEEIKASKAIEPGLNNYECKEYRISEEIISVEEYNGRVYKVIIKVSKNGEVLDIIEGLKLNETSFSGGRIPQ